MSAPDSHLRRALNASACEAVWEALSIAAAHVENGKRSAEIIDVRAVAYAVARLTDCTRIAVHALADLRTHLADVPAPAERRERQWITEEHAP